MTAIRETGWRNPPPSFSRNGGELAFETGFETDYWSRTFYGFTHASGHLWGSAVTGDFSAEATFTADYGTLYDQAGLMLYVDSRTWLKSGVEFSDGVLNLSVVVTRDDQSDWSMLPLSLTPAEPVSLRLTRHAEALRVQYRAGAEWQLVRLAYLPMPDEVEVGPMACSPLRAGLRVRFADFRIAEPIARDLHA